MLVRERKQQDAKGTYTKNGRDIETARKALRSPGCFSAWFCRTSWHKWTAHRAIKTPPPGPGHHLLGVKRARWMVENNAKGELPRGRYPRLVIFQDEDDPTSVTEVDPGDLEATFGAGYKLKRVGIEITDERVTEHIRMRLAWLPEYYDRMLDGNRLNTIEAKNRLANSLSQNSFEIGRIE